MKLLHRAMRIQIENLTVALTGRVEASETT